MAAILVFCGSAKGQNPAFEEAARALGKYIGEHGHSLITGGGAVGLMGVVSDAAMEFGAHVTGIIPEFLQDREVGHSELQDLIVDCTGYYSMVIENDKMLALSDELRLNPEKVIQ